MGIWICDVNGVLVDSTAVICRAFAATAARCGFSFTDAQFRRAKGLPLLDAYRLLDPEGDPFMLRAFHLEYLRNRIAGISACPHVKETLAAARARDVRVAAVTSQGEVAEAYLVTAGLYSYVDCLVTQEEVSRPKPDPESLLQALTLLGAGARVPGPDWAVHVGDTAIDVEAGRNAGVYTIGVTYGMSDEGEIREAAPDRVIHSFRGMRAFLAASPREIGALPVAWPTTVTDSV